MTEVPANLNLAQIPDIVNDNLYGTAVKMVGWGKTGGLRINPHLKVGKVNIIMHEKCLQHIKAFGNEEADFDKREILCTVQDPYVIMADVSDYYFSLLYIFIKEIYGVYIYTYK
jgi:hypothetical protein